MRQDVKRPTLKRSGKVMEKIKEDSISDLSNSIKGLARDSLTDEYGVRNIVTALYSLAESVTLLAHAMVYKKGDE
jgi:hypothetical protein